ncbi:MULTISPECIES: DUF3043 domain-containing protein [unclassified Microbacterium]|uniref:DUF3043 domain-containing protein n=1 Tax=unclassified Microbacterium TaxID=2609290 RepID=UPI00097EE24D|nr:DUF3043 domain-containing protein [Microbacterium sp. JB110]RCS62753.1 DUF3043 domain-containing protein [Microbacterium sp. JB110]SJM62967.1 CblZ, a non-orthologous displasment for Alpha-ribazole-5'-phosphate phosphatase [Frigoribacterium sp. JB110]
MAKTPAPSDNDASTPTVGKGRPTPTRAEREAANRRPLVANTKEARRRAKADLRARQDRARLGQANGEEKFLQPRDRGPQRRWVRDFTDSRWHLGELLMPALIVILVATMFLPYAFQFYGMVGLWVFVLFTVGDMFILSRSVKKRAGEKFGEDKREKGLGWYAAMRSMQMRFMRLPKPQVRVGGAPK